MTIFVIKSALAGHLAIRRKNIMMKRFWPAMALSCLCAELLGCTPKPDSYTDGLPEPTEWRVPPPAYTEEQQKRWEEVQAYLIAQQYKDYKILMTTQSYVGDLIDWVDPPSIPGSEIEPPPPFSPMDMIVPEGTEMGMSEVERHPELQGPVGSIPIVRPRFERYILGKSEALSVEDFVQRFQVPGMPAGQNRLYAGIPSPQPTRTVGAWVNPFGGDVEEGSFSLFEVTASCKGPDPANTLEQVGAVFSRDRANFNDAVLRLQVEYYTAGYEFRGPSKGGWEGFSPGFVPVAGARYAPGMALDPVSTIDGPQYSFHLMFYLLDGKWWLAFNWNFIGYYKAELFDLMNSEACESAVYGEVFDPTPEDWTWTDMGSGRFASEGLGKAASIITPFYYDLSNKAQWISDGFTMDPYASQCYTRSTLEFNANGQPSFFAGGPGGDSAGCD